ncbi:hypothetical protein H8D30_00240 [bacterium]|nr:hypothetical protein [bacterium]
MRVVLALLFLSLEGAPLSTFDCESQLPRFHFTGVERAGLDALGEAVGLPVEEWGWEKAWTEASYQSGWARQALGNPIQTLPDLLSKAETVWGDSFPANAWHEEKGVSPNREGLSSWHSPLLQAIGEARLFLDEIKGGMSIQDRKELEESARAILAGEEGREGRFVALLMSVWEGRSGEEDYRNFSTPPFAEEGRILWRAAVASGGLDGLPLPGVYETEFGRMGIGRMEDDLWEGDFALIIDPGGDDTYLLESGPWRVQVVVDRGGDDIYKTGAWPGAGSGILGFGILLDWEGNDRYIGGRGSWGVGMGGVGLLWDGEGNDEYIGIELTQGAALVGWGRLLDEDGNDSYRAGRMAQGFGWTAGEGTLWDKDGNDIYYAMGTFLHEPLYSDRYQSLSQGFGLGMRYEGYGGGIGILRDSAGNDRYLAEVYCQGAGYWYGVGLLWDEGGHDAYSCHIYGQGAGIHLAAGYLVDEGGDDTYALLDGVGQGGGHDLAVGFLHDWGGNDYYSGAGLAQGSGNANGLGILVDRSGNDGYQGVKGVCQGLGNAGRGVLSGGCLFGLAGGVRVALCV